jgi:hypothetical protein
MRIPKYWRLQTVGARNVGGVYPNGKFEFPLRRALKPEEKVEGNKVIVYEADDRETQEDAEVLAMTKAAVREGIIEELTGGFEPEGHNGHNGHNGYNGFGGNGKLKEGSLIQPSQVQVENYYEGSRKERE